MKVLRGIAAVVCGWLLATVIIFGIEMINFVVYRPDNGKSIVEQMTDMKDNKEAAKAWVASMPTSALLSVLAAWSLGAFFGGGLAALISGRWRLLHAGLVGALILAGTIFNALNMKTEFDYTHPSWMIIAGLLLPLPLSMLAGKLVSPRTPPPSPVGTS